MTKFGDEAPSFGNSGVGAGRDSPGRARISPEEAGEGTGPGRGGAASPGGETAAEAGAPGGGCGGGAGAHGRSDLGGNLFRTSRPPGGGPQDRRGGGISAAARAAQPGVLPDAARVALGRVARRHRPLRPDPARSPSHRTSEAFEAPGARQEVGRVARGRGKCDGASL